MRSIALALLLVASPAFAADQFDLVCTGKQRTSPDGAWKPYAVRYRLDVAAKVYCRFECKSLESIAAVDNARISFASTDAKANSPVMVLHYVDRTDGKWKYYLSGSSGLLGDAEGSCEVAPFSGFPAAKF